MTRETGTKTESGAPTGIRTLVRKAYFSSPQSDYRGIVTLQEQQVMFGFNAPGILGTGFLIAILLIVIGLREKDDFHKKVRYLRSGGILFGIMIIATVFIVYAYLAMTVTLIMTLGDVTILTLVSSLGGTIIGISGYYPISQ